MEAPFQRLGNKMKTRIVAFLAVSSGFFVPFSIHPKSESGSELIHPESILTARVVGSVSRASELASDVWDEGNSSIDLPVSLLQYSNITSIDPVNGLLSEEFVDIFSLSEREHAAVQELANHLVEEVVVLEMENFRRAPEKVKRTNVKPTGELLLELNQGLATYELDSFSAEGRIVREKALRKFSNLIGLKRAPRE